MVRNSALLLVFGMTAATTAACGGGPATSTTPTTTAGKLSVGREIQVFSEPSAVAAVMPVAGHTFVATSQGLDRWDAQGARRVQLVPAH